MALIKGPNGNVINLYYVDQSLQTLSLGKLYYGNQLIWGNEESPIVQSGLLSLDDLVLLSKDELILMEKDNG